MNGHNKYRLTFYLLWFILNVAQAAATQLIDDEAYYWVYSKFPALGYFDHPPMVAWLIKPGYALFHNELGVRLLMVIMNVLTLLLTEKMLPVRNLILFYIIAISIAVIQLGGFIAVPDTPLLFFTALFFYTYKKFIEHSNARNALLLGIVMALLFYTKYHGLLVVLFTVLSNIKLLRNKYAWMSFVVTIILYIPHLYWQWQHDWISFRYHLFESNVSAYHISNSLEYIGGQFLLCGPLIGLLLLPAAFMQQPADKFQRALKFTLIGIYAVFFISSFRGKVEMNWPMPAIVPLIILSHTYISYRGRWIRIARMMAAVSIILILAARIYLIEDIGPNNSIKKRLHYNKEWVQELQSRTGSVPVVFFNSYQRASVYWFYSGVQSHSMNAIGERVNNYSFWRSDNRLLGRAVFLADIYDMHNFTDSIETKRWKIGWRSDLPYIPLENLQFIPDDGYPTTNHDSLIISGRFVSTHNLGFYMGNGSNFNYQVHVGLFKNKEMVSSSTAISNFKLSSGERIRISAAMPKVKSGTYHVIVGVSTKDYFPIHNSRRMQVRFEKH